MTKDQINQAAELYQKAIDAGCEPTIIDDNWVSWSPVLPTEILIEMANFTGDMGEYIQEYI